MAVRYLYNTPGQYVAFVQGDNVFDPGAEWLGFIRNGNEFFVPDGSFAGYILDDDRIARRTNEPRRLRLLRPLRPVRPIRPLRPLRRLRMPRLPYPYEDLFETGVEGISPHAAEGHAAIAELEGAEIYAADNTYLGRVSKDVFDSAALINDFSPYGNPFNPNSIFNAFGPYGSPYSQLSPFNEYSRTPPRLIRQGKVIGYLSKNQLISPRIDPDALLLWLGKSR